MHLSPFEIGMLVCFGASWPFSVYKTWKARTSEGKSFVFLWLVLVGYVCGILYKVFSHYDLVIVLYGLNSLMVLLDIVLCYKFRPHA